MICFFCGKPLNHDFTKIPGYPGPLHVHIQCMVPLAKAITDQIAFLRPVNTKKLGKQMKVWLGDESEKHGVTPHAIYTRLIRRPEHYYPNIEVTRLNKRVVFVRERGAE